MKKSIIAMAVAGALAVPAIASADATLYGSMRIKLKDNDVVKMDVRDASSRIGIKGTSEMFSGATAFYQFEQAVSTETGGWAGSGRLGNLGLTGEFGTAVFGRIWTPFYNWTGATTDILNNDTSGASAYTVGVARASNVIAYLTPVFGGFQAAAAILPNDNGAGDDTDVDIYHAAVKYSANGLHAGLSYMDFDKATAGAALGFTDQTALGLSYEAGSFYVGARYENRSVFGGGSDSEAYGIAASYTINNTKIAANFENDDEISGDLYSLEVQQMLGKASRVFVALTEEGDVAGNGFELGYRVDF